MEREIILAAKKGDQLAFAELNSAYAPLIDSMTDQFCGTGEKKKSDREDLRQEASVAFYRALMSYDADQTEVSFGLYAKICIRNHLISLLRKQRSLKKRRSFEEKKEIPPPDLSAAPDRKTLLASADALLTEFEKTVFLLYIEGKSYREMAFSLGVSVKSVDNALLRAKRKLRREYLV